MQKPADTEFVPSLKIEFNDLLPGLSALGVTVIVEQGQLLGGGGWELVPKLFERFVTDSVVQFMKDNAAQFAILKAVVETFELLEFLHHCLRNSPPATRRADVEMAGQKAEHPLLLKAPFEGSNRFGMAAGFLSPLGGGAVLEENQGSNDLIAPLNRVAEVLLETVKLQLGLHLGFLPCWSPQTGGLGSS